MLEEYQTVERPDARSSARVRDFYHTGQTRLIPLIYALRSGDLYGAEQMALYTADGLRDQFEPFIFAPQGSALKEARQMGFSAEAFSNSLDFARKLRRFLASSEELVFMATDLRQSYALIALNAFYQRKVAHLHIAQGGRDERSGYSRQHNLNNYDVTFVAVSEFVKERLIARHTQPNRIRVIENFLPPLRIKNAPLRLSFTEKGVKKIAVVSRLEPAKRVDLLLDALDLFPALSSLEFTIYGEGSELAALKNRAAGRHPNVTFAGFHANIAEELAKTDLLLHLCPTEPFGLVILEAMAAHVPVLVPDSGGAGLIVSNDVNGFNFRADNAAHLGTRLNELAGAPPDFLNAVAAGGKHLLNIHFSADTALERYRRLITDKKVSAVKNLTEGRLIV